MMPFISGSFLGVLELVGIDGYRSDDNGFGNVRLSNVGQKIYHRILFGESERFQQFLISNVLGTCK